MSNLNHKQILEIIKDPNHRTCIYMTSFITIGGEEEPVAWFLTEDIAVSLVNSIVKVYVDQGVELEDILFKVHFSGDTMFLEVNYPPEVH